MKYAALILAAGARAVIVWSAGSPGGGSAASFAPAKSPNFDVLLCSELLWVPRSRWTGSIDRRNRQARVPRHRRRCRPSAASIEEGRPGTADAGFRAKRSAAC